MAGLYKHAVVRQKLNSVTGPLERDRTTLMSAPINDLSPVRDLRVAVTFLTRIPTGRIADLATSDLARAAWAFPLAGFFVGLLAGAALYLANMTDISPLACALIALAVQAVVTGALHEDGLADVADGFGGHEKAKILSIMRDSRIGSYGVLALIFSVAIRTTMIAGIPGAGLAFFCMIAAAVFSRSVLPMVMNRMPPARDDGLARDAGTPTLQGALIAFGIGAFALFTLLPPSVALAALVIGSALAALILLWAHRRLGGQTGDVLGALQQVFEIAVFSAAAGWSSVFYE